jgi:hypothetical protein
MKFPSETWKKVVPSVLTPSIINKMAYEKEGRLCVCVCVCVHVHVRALSENVLFRLQ